MPNIKLNDLGLCNVYGLTDLSLLSDNDREIFNHSEVQILDGQHRFFSKPFDKNKQMFELTWPIFDGCPFTNLYMSQEVGHDIREQSLIACKDVIKDWPFNWLKEFMDKTLVKDIIVHPLYDLDPLTIDFSILPKNIILNQILCILLMNYVEFLMEELSKIILCLNFCRY